MESDYFCGSFYEAKSGLYTHGVAEPIAALNRVRLAECGEALVDLRLTLPEMRVLRDNSVPFVRESVSQMLVNAMRLLPSGYTIGVREAWRSPERQKLLYDAYQNKLRAENPQWSLATLRRMTNRFFAPYDQKAPPGHATGGAVDVWLLRSNGETIDLHGKAERFRSAPTYSRNVDKEVQKLRLILHDAMASAGFTNCRDEWWHYSYGDAGWAVRAGRSTCIYGLVRPPEEAYRQADEKFREEFLKNPPF